MEPVLYEVREGVATLTFNRPERMNAMDGAMKRALLKALQEAGKDQGVRAVLLTGAGRGFCAGQDLQEMQGGVAVGEVVRQQYNPLILCMRQLPKPIVGAINGVAAGAGMSLALACDLRVASEAASFMQAFVKIGLVPDSGSYYFLRQLVGEAKAFELAALGDTLSAQEAHALGLVNRVVPAEQLMQEAQALARRLAAGPSRAIALIKQGLQQATDLEKTLELEAYYQEMASRTADHREGVAAFLEKRMPVFTGV